MNEIVDTDLRRGRMCGLLAAGLRMEGLLRVAMERPETVSEISPQIREAFELYSTIFRQLWPDEPIAEAVEPAVEPVVEPTLEPVVELPCEETAPEPEPTPEPEPEPTPEPERVIVVEAVAEAEPEPCVKPLADTLKVDELLARKESADLRRAFTLNDKFRFRRTLFGGSDARFSAMLDEIEKAPDMRRAEAVILAGLDSENEDFEDFMNIIKAHFGEKL